MGWHCTLISYYLSDLISWKERKETKEQVKVKSVKEPEHMCGEISGHGNKVNKAAAAIQLYT
jgi:hypothetical protein